ncbi:hypothetical protein GJ744_010622 [Endocarpon pusillum]|uniref:Uncharacterized protein n=1 Tax=Endocarpon pusillum TaxID=364733 RepID=A0A8H7AU57_9EURO|nr:hypothetical protein GJ744_010622 [Endocarpon pusillum]
MYTEKWTIEISKLDHLPVCDGGAKISISEGDVRVFRVLLGLQDQLLFSMSKPFILLLVTDGRLDEGNVTLYSFEPNLSRPDKDHALPLYEENGAKPLVKLTADLSSIPTSMLPSKEGADRKKYYHITFQIRVNFKPANMTYCLWYRNTCYGTVDAGYL